MKKIPSLPITALPNIFPFGKRVIDNRGAGDGTTSGRGNIECGVGSRGRSGTGRVVGVVGHDGDPPALVDEVMVGSNVMEEV